MKANELRIGNIVRWGDHDTTVDINMLWSFDVYSQGGISGEPLTEEWLLKFGFEKIRGAHPSWYNKKYAITRDFEVQLIEKTLIYSGKNYIEYNYVHQLQNLYFVLTGEELTL